MYFHTGREVHWYEDFDTHWVLEWQCSLLPAGQTHNVKQTMTIKKCTHIFTIPIVGLESTFDESIQVHGNKPVIQYCNQLTFLKTLV
jgi:hypothetical protein